MKALRFLAEMFFAAVLAAFFLSKVSFAACEPVRWAIMLGTLTHTCDNRFLVNDVPLDRFLRQYRKTFNKKDRDQVMALDELMSAVAYLRKQREEEKD